MLFSRKCALGNHPGARKGVPGMHPQSRRKQSEYGMQLRAKQRTKRFYGVLESQFRRFYARAERMPGKTGENLLALLELRLDNIVYRLGFAESRAHARQLVTHGHIEVNGKKLDIPSATLSVNDEVTVSEKARKFKVFEEMSERPVPGWLSVDSSALKGTVLSIPTREEVDVDVEETLIVELYSK